MEWRPKKKIEILDVAAAHTTIVVISGQYWPADKGH